MNNNQVKFLCLDLGTTTGWAVGTAATKPTSGRVQFKTNRWQGGGVRFLKFQQFLNDCYQTHAFDWVLFEEVRRHLGVDAAHVYGGFLGQLTAWCESKSIAYEGVPVGTIKRHATGKGNASKDLMTQAMTSLGHEPQDDNEADALALWYWVTSHRVTEVV